MSYKLPSVSVFQILLRASQNLADSELLPCLVGSINQVVKDSALNLVYPITNSTIVYPNLKIGAIVDTTKVKIKVKNAFTEIKSTTVGTTLVAGSKTIIGAAGAFSEAKSGDMIEFSTAGHGTYTIDTVLNSTTATTLETINYPAASGETFKVTRSVGDVYATLGGATYDFSSFTITSLKYATYNIVAGSAYLEYVALRKDLQGFYEVTNADQLAIDMDVDFENPLGFNLGIVAPSASGGKKVLAYITEDETDASYTNALTDLGIRKDAYLLVPMSQSSVVKNAFAAHAIAMSQPDPSYFRSALLSATLTTQTTLASGTLTK